MYIYIGGDPPPPPPRKYYKYYMNNIYIYHTFSCALGSYGAPGLRNLRWPLGRQVGLQVGLVLPSWASKSPWTAKLDCQGALGRHSGLQLGVQVPLQSAPDLQICSTVRHFSHFFRKLQFLVSKCSWTAFWQLLGPAWTPFGFHLELLGRLLGSTWGLWGAFGAHLGASWAPLGLHLGFLGASWANLEPSGRQMGSKWTPAGRQMDAKLDCHNGCKFQRTP